MKGVNINGLPYLNWMKCETNHPTVFVEVLVSGFVDQSCDKMITTIGRKTFDSWEVLCDFEPVKTMKPIYWAFIPEENARAVKKNKVCVIV